MKAGRARRVARRWLLRVMALEGGLLALSCSGKGCARPSPPAALWADAICSAKVLEARYARDEPTIDGQLIEPAWRRAPSSKAFVDATERGAVVPHTEVRLLWTARALFVAFYAADEDLRHDDWVSVTFRPRPGAAPWRWQLNATGELRCLTPACVHVGGVTAAVHLDGTLDDARDDDEEWTGELVFPFAALGTRAPGRRDLRLMLGFARRDRPKMGREHLVVWSPPCGHWKDGVVQFGQSGTGIGKKVLPPCPHQAR